MSTHTMSLHRAIDLAPNGNIGLNSYPIWSEDYRPTLNQKIIDHYINREIAHESLPIFTQKMRVTMGEIMPYYNQLYASTQIVFDPLSTVDFRTISSTETDQTSGSKTVAESLSDNTATSRNVTQDTPQTMLSDDEDYASGAADSLAKSASTGSATDDTTAEAKGTMAGDTRMFGYQGVASDLLMRYRESLINIDLMIITALEPMFFQVFGNADEYLSHSAFERGMF